MKDMWREFLVKKNDKEAKELSMEKESPLNNPQSGLPSES